MIVSRQECIFFGLLFFFASSIYADDGDSRNIVWNGFVMEEIGNSYQHDEFKLSKIASIASINMDAYLSSGWTAKINLQAGYDAAYAVEGRDKFSSETLDVYETDVRLNEAYTDIDINSWLNIRVGRQYFSWGESNSEQISDIGNPRDLRELGLQNAKDIRLPIGATKITVYDLSWEYSLIAIHEARLDELGAESSEFDTFLNARKKISILSAHEPANSVENTGLLSRIFISNDWGDISFFGGRKFDGFPLLVFKGVDLNAQKTVFLPEYYKLNTYGFFGNVTEGSWQLKFDVAETLDKPLGFNPEYVVAQLGSKSVDSIISFVRKDVIKSMLGIEYSGFSDTQISVEYIAEYIGDYDNRLRNRAYINKLSAFISRTFDNGNITSTLWMNHINNEKTDIFRLDLAYNYSDSVKYFISLSGIENAKKDTYYYDYQEVDRLAIGVKLSF